MFFFAIPWFEMLVSVLVNSGICLILQRCQAAHEQLKRGTTGIPRSSWILPYLFHCFFCLTSSSGRSLIFTSGMARLIRQLIRVADLQKLPPFTPPFAFASKGAVFLKKSLKNCTKAPNGMGRADNHGGVPRFTRWFSAVCQKVDIETAPSWAKQTFGTQTSSPAIARNSEIYFRKPMIHLLYLASYATMMTFSCWSICFSRFAQHRQKPMVPHF